MGPQNEATVDITLCQMFILPLVGGPIYLLLLARIAMQSIRCGPLLHKQVLRGLCVSAGYNHEPYKNGPEPDDI